MEGIVGYNADHLTLRELRWAADQRIDNDWRQTATITAMIINAQGRRWKKWVTAEQMLGREVATEDEEVVTGKELQAIFGAK